MNNHCFKKHCLDFLPALNLYQNITPSEHTAPEPLALPHVSKVLSGE